MGATYDSDRGFTLIRSIAAPPAAVFEAWTNPDRLDWFFNPDAPMPDEPIDVDLTIGGAWRQRMVVDPATSYVTGGVYQEIDPANRLSFYWGAVGGWPEIDAAHPDEGPLATITLDGRGQSTEMAFTLSLPDSWDEERVRTWEQDGPRKGWNQTIDRLVEAVEGTR